MILLYKLTLFFTSLIGSLSILIWSFYKFVGYFFGKDLSYEQFLWAIDNRADGVDKRFVISVTCFIFIVILLLLIWNFSVLNFKKLVFVLKNIFVFIFTLVTNDTKFSHIFLSKLFLLILAVVSCNAGYKKVDRMLEISEYYKVQQEGALNDHLKEYYWVPKLSEINFPTKKNLVLVMGESLEFNFNSESEVTPRLNKLAIYNANFTNMQNVSGSSWTIGALTGWHFGLPLKVPTGGNNYISHKGFLPNALSVFDVLKENGYKLVLIMGSDSNFSGMKQLFSNHGDFTIMDSSYWKSEGWDVNEHEGAWGFND